MSSSQQLVRVNLEKNFFWHGILTINEFNVISFFDVKTKKDVPDAPTMIGLYTNDVPAIMITESDTVHVNFNIENNISGTPTRFKVVDTTFFGSELARVVEESQGEKSQITVSLNSGEWTFSLQGTVYILRSFIIYVSLAQLKKYVTDL